MKVFFEIAKVYTQKKTKKISFIAVFPVNFLHRLYSPLSCLHCSHGGFMLPGFVICFVTSILQGKHLQDMILRLRPQICTSVKKQLTNT